MKRIVDEILHNFWLKVTALVLAVLTWLYVTEQIVKR